MLTRPSLIAMAMAGAVLASEASAQTPSCGSASEVSLYFERDRVELNEFSKLIVERIVEEAKSCGLTQVVAQTRADTKRRAAISDIFQARGINVVLVGPAPTADPAGDAIATRAAKMRLTMANRIG